MKLIEHDYDLKEITKVYIEISLLKFFDLYNTRLIFNIQKFFYKTVVTEIVCHYFRIGTKEKVKYEYINSNGPLNCFKIKKKNKVAKYLNYQYLGCGVISV